MEFLTLSFLIPLAIGAVIGAFIGIGLGRRSTTANEAYDRIREQAALREAQLQAKIDAMKAKYGEK